MLACLVAAAGSQFGPMVTSERSTGLKRIVPTLDLGVGLAFELDTAELQPQVRALFKRASVCALFSDVAAACVRWPVWSSNVFKEHCSSLVFWSVPGHACLVLHALPHAC